MVLNKFVKCITIIFLFIFIILYLFMKKDKNVIFDSAEYLKVAGKWRIGEFVGTGTQSHIIPVPEGYEPTEDEIKEHNQKYINQIVDIKPKNVLSMHEPCELGYYYEDAEELFFGYKVTNNIELIGPIMYARIEYKPFDKTIKFIIDSKDTSVIDINAYFYKLEFIE